MRLTGKAKEQFEGWLFGTTEEISFLDSSSAYRDDVKDRYFKTFWRDLPESMQWGIFQDWADSMGYDVQIVSDLGQTRYGAELYDKKSVYVADGVYSNRQEARNAAIDKLNEIVNGQELTIKEQ